MDFGLLAPALIGGAMVIVGAIIVAWMNAHKPTLELPQPEDKQLNIPFDLDKARSRSAYNIVFASRHNERAN